MYILIIENLLGLFRVKPEIKIIKIINLIYKLESFLS